MRTQDIANKKITKSMNVVKNIVFSKLDSNCVRFEVLTAVTMKNAVFWDVT
jgi:hypothetical protein